MQKLVKLFQAQGEGGQHLAGLVILLAVGHDAGLDQAHDAVADHFGVHAQIVFVGQLHHHRIRNAAIADLQRRPVGNHVGHIPAYHLLHRTWRLSF